MLGLFRVSVRVKIRVKVSDPSSPIVRELVFSLTRLSFRWYDLGTTIDPEPPNFLQRMLDDKTILIGPLK